MHRNAPLTTELASFDQPEPVTTDDLAQLIDDIREDWADLEAALSTPLSQRTKAALLTSLGVTVSYDPVARTARVACTPRVRETSCRRGEWTLWRTPPPTFLSPEYPVGEQGWTGR